jgi:hypothetical protein
MRGGAEGEKKICFHYREYYGNSTNLRKNSTNLRKNLISDELIGNTTLKKWQPVEIIETRKDPKSKEIFAKVIADGVEGWVNINYLYEDKDPSDRTKPCFPQ